MIKKLIQYLLYKRYLSLSWIFLYAIVQILELSLWQQAWAHNLYNVIFLALMIIILPIITPKKISYALSNKYLYNALQGVTKFINSIANSSTFLLYFNVFSIILIYATAFIFIWWNNVVISSITIIFIFILKAVMIVGGNIINRP